MSDDEVQLVALEGGGRQVRPLPSERALRDYYEMKYFQQCTSASYDLEYSEDEKQYFANRARVSEYLWNNSRSLTSRRFLDVGCGEGFAAKYFREAGWDVTCLDYTESGLRRHNPELLVDFVAGDIVELLTGKLGDRRYDLVQLSHVLEHVPNPQRLLSAVQGVMSPSGMLVATVPNDYSAWQDELIRLNLTEETWLSPPDHLNYFNSRNFPKFMESCNWEVEHVLMGFPIESFLANEHSNYVADRSLGRGAHVARIRTDNYLVGRGLPEYVAYMKAAVGCDYGRTITAYCKPVA